MEKRKNTLLLLQFGLPKKILISAVIMLALIALVYFLHIPNPNMILIAGLVLCSALFGYGGGIVAAVIMLFLLCSFFPRIIASFSLRMKIYGKSVYHWSGSRRICFLSVR